MIEGLRAAASRHVGAKQTLKAIESRQAQVVYLAGDAEQRVIDPIRRRAETQGVTVVEVGTMKELGRMCGIEVGAAAAAILTRTP